jgi:ribosomal protein S18 acetylase RimI-like enzyme
MPKRSPSIEHVEIRPFRPEDRPAIARLCAESGLQGRLDEYFCDQEIFAAIWLDPFLKGSPEECLTVVHQGEVAGYLVASMDDWFYVRSARILWPYVFRLTWRFLSGRYQAHPQSVRFAWWALLRSWREIPRTPRRSACFHFNLAPELRGGQLGHELTRLFIERARFLGRRTWHTLVFTGEIGRPRRFWQSLGFEVYSSRPCTLFSRKSEVICVVKPVGEANPRALLRPKRPDGSAA